MGLVLLVITGCGSADGPEAEPTRPTTTTVARTTSTVSPTTTEPACPSPPAVRGDGMVTRRADVDGDGAADRLFSVPQPSAEERPSFVVGVELAAGGRAVTEVPGDGVATVEVLGGADLDADGGDEVWARVGAGASVSVIGLFRFHGCGLSAVTFASGAPVELPVGGSVRSLSGVACGTTEGPDQGFTARSATNTQGLHYETVSTEYQLDEGVATVAREERADQEQGDGEMEPFATFACGDLSL